MGSYQIVLGTKNIVFGTIADSKEEAEQKAKNFSEKAMKKDDLQINTKSCLWRKSNEAA